MNQNRKARNHVILGIRHIVLPKRGEKTRLSTHQRTLICLKQADIADTIFG